MSERSNDTHNRALSRQSEPTAARSALRLAAAAVPFETMESRTLFTGTIISSWNFDNLTIGTNTTPAASTGATFGSATSIGMNYGTATDSSNIYALAGSSDGSSSTNQTWRLQGSNASNSSVNGWNNSAGIGTQGAQFLVNTTGYTGVSLQFDWYASTKGERNLAVEYTTDGTTWLNTGETLTPGGSATVATNTTSANTITGSYFKAPGTQQFANAMTVDLSGISAASNDPNFGVRIVNASTGSDVTNISGGAFDNTAGNWRFDEVKILGTSAGAVAPTVTTSPVSQTVNGNTTVTFTAAANGTPPPAVQWQVEASGQTSFTNIAGATSTSYSFTATTAVSGSQYRALFTNSAGSVNSAAATLTVPAAPLIVTQPANQNTTVGSSATFTAAAFGTPAPTVQWYVIAPGASTGTAITGATSPSYTVTPTEGQTGSQYYAVFTNSVSSTQSTSATLTVVGTPIVDWSLPSVASSPVVSPQPTPTIGSGSALPLGMDNSYSGLQSYPEDDITATAGAVDTGYSENLWRIRGGSGAGATGSPGSPEGWSSVAPQYTQGAEFDISTVGYQDLSFHLDWYSTTSGVRDLQPQYTTDGSTWNNYGPVLTADGNDYYGTTNSTTAPTGIFLNFQNVTGVNNDANFGIRLVSAYDPALPLINDGNTLITDGSGNPIPHGQYAAATPGAADTSQQLLFGGSNLSGTFTLTLGTQTTAPISYTNAYNGTGGSLMAANIQAALAALPGIGTKGVTVTTMDLNATNYTVTFTSAQTSALTTNASGLSGTSPAVTVPYAGALVPYTIAGSGNWRFGNIELSGDTISGSPGILTEPTGQTATLPNGSQGGQPTVNFSSAAYSEVAATAAWQVSTDGGNSWSTAAGTVTTTTTGNVTNSILTVTATATSQSGWMYRTVYSNTDGSATTNSATLLVVIPIAPTITASPISISVLSGSTAAFTATATGLPLTASNVQWQYRNGSTGSWSNISTGVTTTATTVNGYNVDSSTLTLTASTQNGYQYQAVFSNTLGSVTTSPATLTVLAIEPAITQWTFGGNASTGVVAAPDNSPTPDVNIAPGVLNSLGFDDANFETEYNGVPSVTADDVTNTKGTANTGFAENTWRIRGGSSASAPGAPANGWDALAPQYSQGAEADIDTTGYKNIYVTFDWATTAQGVRDLQEQYTLDGSTWTNINAPLVAPSAGDFYGATASAAPTGALIDLTKITGANNNPHFGIRLVAAYDAALPLITDSEQTILNDSLPALPEPHGQYASATLVNGQVVPLNGSSGNWRFGNISVNGVVALPAWLASNSIASWNATTKVLTVTGASTIIGDPGTDEPIINASGSAAVLTVNPTTARTINIGSLNLTNGASVIMTTAATTHVLIVQNGSSNFQIDSTSHFDLGDNFLDIGGGSISTVTGLIQAGELTTSDTAAGGLGAVGAIVNGNTYGSATTLGLFDGANPGASDVLVRYTYYGDANLDGQVDGSDYTLVDNGFNNAATGWLNGDFNYDNVIDGSDYTLIDNAFNTQGGRLLPTAQVAAPAAQITSATAVLTGEVKLVSKSSPAIPVMAGSVSDLFSSQKLKGSSVLSMIE